MGKRYNTTRFTYPDADNLTIPDMLVAADGQFYTAYNIRQMAV